MQLLSSCISLTPDPCPFKRDATLIPFFDSPAPGPLVVLERLEGQGCVVVSRKPSLVAAARAGQLPCSLDQVGGCEGAGRGEALGQERACVSLALGCDGFAVEL